MGLFFIVEEVCIKGIILCHVLVHEDWCTTGVEGGGA